MKVYVQLVVVVLVALLGAGASYWGHPRAPHFVSSSLELTLEAVDGKEQLMWVDARTNEDFEVGHLDGAISLNEEYWEEGFSEFMMLWSPDLDVVVYCSSHSCARSHEVAQRLRSELGVDNIYALTGGWEALQAR